MSARPTVCTQCRAPIALAFNPQTGSTLALNVKPIPGGRYEIQRDGTAHVRLTKTGKLKQSGKGHSLHAGACGDRPSPTPIKVMHGVAIKAPPKLPDPEPEAAEPPPVLRELVELIGPDGNVDDYVDWTDHPSGPATCGECHRKVIVCYHVSRPDGTRPVILDSVKAGKLGAWVAKRRTGSDIIMAEFLGYEQALANRFNHRLICPESEPTK